MQPNLKASELVDRINAFAESRERDEVTRRALRREIETLKKADPAIAFAMVGMVAAAEHREAEARQQFENARRLRPHDSWIELNYSKALHNLGYNRDARLAVRAIYDTDPSDLSVLDELIHRTVVSARPLEAAELVERRNGLKPKEDHPYAESAQELAIFCRAHELSDDETEDLLEFTLGLLHEAGYYHDWEVFSVRSDGESEWMSGMLEVGEPVETIVELNKRLAESLATRDVSPEVSTLVNFMFVPSSE